MQQVEYRLPCHECGSLLAYDHISGVKGVFHPRQIEAIWEYLWRLPVPRQSTGVAGPCEIRKCDSLMLFGEVLEGRLVEFEDPTIPRFYEYRQLSDLGD